MDDDDTLRDNFRRQLPVIGVPISGRLALASAGSITLPVPGAVTGYVVGFALDTGSCMAVNLRYKNDLKRLLEDWVARGASHGPDAI